MLNDTDRNETRKTLAQDDGGAIWRRSRIRLIRRENKRWIMSMTEGIVFSAEKRIAAQVVDVLVADRRIEQMDGVLRTGACSQKAGPDDFLEFMGVTRFCFDQDQALAEMDEFAEFLRVSSGLHAVRGEDQVGVVEPASHRGDEVTGGVDDRPCGGCALEG